MSMNETTLLDTPDATAGAARERARHDGTVHGVVALLERESRLLETGADERRRNDALAARKRRRRATANAAHHASAVVQLRAGAWPAAPIFATARCGLSIWVATAMSSVRCTASWQAPCTG